MKEVRGNKKRSVQWYCLSTPFRCLYLSTEDKGTEFITFINSFRIVPNINPKCLLTSKAFMTLR